MSIQFLKKIYKKCEAGRSPAFSSLFIFPAYGVGILDIQCRTAVNTGSENRKKHINLQSVRVTNKHIYEYK